MSTAVEIRLSFIAAAALALLCLSTAAVAQNNTKLGSGDVVRITVYGQSDLETVARITRDGTITFPLIGEVRLDGLTNRQAENRIEKRLADGKFVRNPQVTIFVQERVQQDSEVVTVLGQVKKPGRFSVDALSNDGAQSIVGLLALAGGIGDDAADYLILSKQTTGERIRVDLVSLLRDGDLTQNYELSAGDIVLVPTMDVFYVYGEVEKPGRYRLERNTTVMQAISVSGGLTSRGTEKGLSIRRRDDAGKMLRVNTKLDDPVRPDDVVFVGESLF